MEIVFDLVLFLDKFIWGVKVLGSFDVCKWVVIENVEDVVK